MDKFFFEKPSIERKDEIIEYIKEYEEYNSDTNGCGFLDRILYGYSFEDALDCCLRMEEEKHAMELSNGRCQSKTLLLIRSSDNRIVGSINIRWNLSKEMLNFGGHIGYGIRPTLRRKGYNKINLYLGLIEVDKMGLDRVMLSCEHDNIGSKKSIEALGGVLERSEIDPYDNILTDVYWIDVKDSIEKYKDVYKEFINEKSI